MCACVCVLGGGGRDTKTDENVDAFPGAEQNAKTLK